MNYLKKLQKKIASQSDIRPEISVVHCFKTDDYFQLVATNSFNLVHIKKTDGLSVSGNVIKELPKNFYFNRQDVLKIKNFTGKMTWHKYENGIIYYSTQNKTGKHVERNAMLRIDTDLEFTADWKSLFEYKDISISNAKFNYKYINQVGELLHDNWSGIDIVFKSRNGKDGMANMMCIENEIGRGLIMAMNR